MAAGDIFVLERPMAARLVHILYVLVVVLIAIGVILGVVRGVTAATRMPPPAPIAAPVTPDGAQAQAPQPGMRGGLRGNGPRRFAGRGGPERALGMNMRRQPALYGGFLMLRALVAGFILLLVVRILAEIALAILALKPRDSAA